MMRIRNFTVVLLALIGWQIVTYGQGYQDLNTYLKDVHEKHVVPGFSVVVVKGNETVFAKGYGKEIAGGNKNFTINSLSAIGSLAKSLTAMAIMQLVEKGLVDLDAAVVDYLPDFQTANKKMSDQITVRMLLNNTAGLQDSFIPSSENSMPSLEPLLQSLSNIFLTKDPGQSYQYSNTNFSVAGIVISRVTGLSYQDYVEQHIFSPLRMTNSIVSPMEGSIPFAKGHHFGSQPIPAQSTVFAYSQEYVPAGSNTWSTAIDLGNYLKSLLNWGAFENIQILTRRSMEALWEPNVTFQGLGIDEGGEGQQYQYGLGWMISEINGRKIYHHGGSTGTMSSFMMIDKEKNLGVALLFNLDLTFIDKNKYLPHYSIANNILHLASGDSTTAFGIPKNADRTLNTFELSEGKEDVYEGVYEYQTGGLPWINFGLTIKVAINEKNQLQATVFRSTEVVSEFELDFVNPGLTITRNIAIPEQVQFYFTPKGEIKNLLWRGRLYQKVQDEYCDPQFVYNIKEKEAICLPDPWYVESRATGFEAVNRENGSQIAAWIPADASSEFESLFIGHFTKEEIKNFGVKTSESISIWWWEKQSFQLKDNSLVTIFRCLNPKEPYVLLCRSSPTFHTDLVGGVMADIAKDLAIK